MDSIKSAPMIVSSVHLSADSATITLHRPGVWDGKPGPTRPYSMTLHVTDPALFDLIKPGDTTEVTVGVFTRPQ